MSLRRSQRGRRPTTFNVGDVVEIVHSSGVSTGQLLHKVAGSSGKQSHVRWLVTFDHDDRADEEVSERSFGRLVHSATDDQRPRLSSSSSSTRGLEAGGEGLTRGKSNPVVVESALQNASGDKNSGGRVSSTSSDCGSGDNSSGERNLNGGVKTAATSKRKKDDEAASIAASAARATGRKKLLSSVKGGTGRKRRRGDGETRITTRSRARREGVVPSTELNVDVNDVVRKAKANGTRGGRRGGKRPMKKHKNEEVVKVEMLTGTLYLYRGENPRAEFIRYF